MSSNDSCGTPLTETASANPIAIKDSSPAPDVLQSLSQPADYDSPISSESQNQKTSEEGNGQNSHGDSQGSAKEGVDHDSLKSEAIEPVIANGEAECSCHGESKGTASQKAPNFTQELQSLKNELESINFKETTRLITVENKLNRLRKLIPEVNLKLRETTTPILSALQAKVHENGQHQLRIEASTKTLITKLEALLNTEIDESEIHTALSDWQEIQENFNASSGDVRARLREMTSPLKEKIQALRERMLSLGAERKRSIIKQMEALHESNLKIHSKVKTINTLNQKWKTLGRSNFNDELWQQFKVVSDLAYAPCKLHFKARKKEMAANLRVRKALCDSLEATIESINKSEVDTSALNQLLREAESNWKKSSPVEQTKIRSLQKRFYGLMGIIRKHRKKLYQESVAKKTSLITQLQKLADSGDKREAMARAKVLQKEWKTISPTSYREDKLLWERFRETCDKVFAKREPSKASSKNHDNRAVQQIQENIDALKALNALNDQELRNARADFNATVRAFTGALNHRAKKQQSQLIDQFNHLKRSLESRFGTLPDKKSQLLMNRIESHTRLLQNVEEELLNGSEEFSAIKAKFDTEAWQQLETTGNTEFDSLLQSRASNLMNKDNQLEYQKCALAAESRLRELCILLEIRAGVETPEADQAQRMSLQLSQLRSGFGQNKPNQNDNIKFAHETRMLSLCLGPIQPWASDSLRERLSESFARLLRQ